MTIGKCYGRGFKAAAARPVVVVLLWLFNLILAAVAADALASPLDAYFGRSLTLDGLMASFDFNTLQEFLAADTAVAGDVARAFLLAVIAYLLAWPFFQGGILNSLLPGTGRTERKAASFFGGGGRFYGRFFRLEVLSLVLWIPAGFLFLFLSLLLDFTATNPNAEYLRFLLVIAKIGIALLIYNVVRMILDYARIGIAVYDTRRVFEGLLDATRFVLGRLGRTFALFYLFALTALPFLAGYVALRLHFPQTTAGRVAVVFFLGQVSILVRGLIRVACQAGQMEFLRSFEAAQDPGGKGDHGLEEVENRADRYPEELERQEKEPNNRIEEKGEQGQGPADHEQNEP